MNKKLDIYTLLGLIKDGKAPKKIKVTGNIYEYDEELEFYYTKRDKTNYRVLLGGLSEEINLVANAFNDNVEILDEEDEFIDIEEFSISYSLDYIDYKNIDVLKNHLNKDFQTIFDTLDKLIKNQKLIINKLKEEGK